MIHFECDYNEGTHPKIIKALTKTNNEQLNGYGLDGYCNKAKSIIKELCNKQDVDIHFIAGGTQTNTIVISSILKPYQGVISADIGHINVHETGAIEAKGHKIIALNNKHLRSAKIWATSPF